MSALSEAERASIEFTKVCFGLLVDGTLLTTELLFSTAIKLLSKSHANYIRAAGGHDLLRTRLHYWKSQSYVEHTIANKKRVYGLTKKGLQKLDKLSFKSLKPSVPSDWDEMWRLVTYDVPETRRNERASIRRLLDELGFKRIQRSVWIHCMPCDKFIEKLNQDYGKKDGHILLIRTVRFKGDQRIITSFRRSGYVN